MSRKHPKATNWRYPTYCGWVRNPAPKEWLEAYESWDEPAVKKSWWFGFRNHHHCITNHHDKITNLGCFQCLCASLFSLSLARLAPRRWRETSWNSWTTLACGLVGMMLESSAPSGMWILGAKNDANDRLNLDCSPIIWVGKMNNDSIFMG